MKDSIVFYFLEFHMIGAELQNNIVTFCERRVFLLPEWSESTKQLSCMVHLWRNILDSLLDHIIVSTLWYIGSKARSFYCCISRYLKMWNTCSKWKFQSKDRNIFFIHNSCIILYLACVLFFSREDRCTVPPLVCLSGFPLCYICSWPADCSDPL